MTDNNNNGITNNDVNGKTTKEQSSQNSSLNISTVATKPNSKLTSSEVVNSSTQPYFLPSLIGAPASRILTNEEYMLQDLGTNVVYQGKSMNMPQMNQEFLSPTNNALRSGLPTPDLGMLAQNAVAQEMTLRHNMQMGFLNNIYQNRVSMEGYPSHLPFLTPSPLAFYHSAPRNIPILNGNTIGQYRNIPYHSLSPFNCHFQAINSTFLKDMKEEGTKGQENQSSYTYPFFLPIPNNDMQVHRSSTLTPLGITGGQQNPGVNVSVTVNVNDGRIIPTLYSPTQCQEIRNPFLHLNLLHNPTAQVSQPQNHLQVRHPLHNTFSLNSGLGSSQSSCISSLMGRCVHCHKLVESTGIKVVCADCEREEVLMIKDYLKNNIFNENDEEEEMKNMDADKEKPKSQQKIIKEEIRDSTTSLIPSPSLSAPIEASLKTTVEIPLKLSSTGVPKSTPGKHKLDAPQNSADLKNDQAMPEHPSKKIKCSPASSPLGTASSLVSNLFAISKLDENIYKEVESNAIDSEETSDDNIRDVEMADEDMRLIGDLSPSSPTSIMDSWNTDEKVVSNVISNATYLEHKSTSTYNEHPGESSPVEDKHVNMSNVLGFKEEDSKT